MASTVLCSFRSGDPQLIGEAYATLKEICRLVSLCVYTIVSLCLSTLMNASLGVSCMH